MGPLSRIRALLTAFLVMLPRKALAPSLYRGGSQPFLTALTGGEVFVDIAAGLFLAILVVVSGRRLIGAAPGAAMARLAMPLSGGSAQSGALRAAAGGGAHALPAAAPSVSRGGPSMTDARHALSGAAHMATRLRF